MFHGHIHRAYNAMKFQRVREWDGIPVINACDSYEFDLPDDVLSREPRPSFLARRAMEKWQAQFFNHTVSDIMTRKPKCVLPNTKITEIQRIMQRYKIHTVLVVDQMNHLLGVVDHYSCMV